MEHSAAEAGRTAYSDLPLELWTAILRQLASSAPYTAAGVPRQWPRRSRCRADG